MFVKSDRYSCLRRWPVLAVILAVGGATTLANAQTVDLPSSPSPNPSSLANPYFGSVTLHPATGEVLKLSLDERSEEHRLNSSHLARSRMPSSA